MSSQSHNAKEWKTSIQKNDTDQQQKEEEEKNLEQTFVMVAHRWWSDEGEQTKMKAKSPFNSYLVYLFLSNRKTRAVTYNRRCGGTVHLMYFYYSPIHHTHTLILLNVTK